MQAKTESVSGECQYFAKLKWYNAKLVAKWLPIGQSYKSHDTSISQKKPFELVFHEVDL